VFVVSAPSPQRFHPELAQDTISADQRQPLDFGLCDEQSVEGVAMVVWQLAGQQGMTITGGE
jgi:hypothetical protein